MTRCELSAEHRPSLPCPPQKTTCPNHRPRQRQQLFLVRASHLRARRNCHLAPNSTTPPPARARTGSTARPPGARRVLPSSAASLDDRGRALCAACATKRERQHVAREPRTTGVALISVDATGEKQIAVAPATQRLPRRPPPPAAVEQHPHPAVRSADVRQPRRRPPRPPCRRPHPPRPRPSLDDLSLPPIFEPPSPISKTTNYWEQRTWKWSTGIRIADRLFFKSRRAPAEKIRLSAPPSSPPAKANLAVWRDGDISSSSQRIPRSPRLPIKAIEHNRRRGCLCGRFCCGIGRRPINVQCGCLRKCRCCPCNDRAWRPEALPGGGQ